MSTFHTLQSSDIRLIGEALYGIAWQGEMAKALGVPRQSVGYYLKAGGVKGPQTAAIIGLLARAVAGEAQTAKVQQATSDARQAELLGLLRRFERDDKNRPPGAAQPGKPRSA